MNSNPIVYLARRAWENAGRHRPLMLLYLTLFAGAQALSLAEPFVIGRMLNSVQAAGGSANILRAVVTGAGLYLLLQFAFWIFHGPARVFERYVAFRIRVRFRSTLFRVMTELPLQWHRDNHSGETIDRMNRAATALFEFSQNSFMIIYMVLRLTGVLAILLWFIPAAGAVALATTAATFGLVFGFDKILYGQYRALNGFERRVASAIHDYVTNMSTVLTLRLESRVLQETLRRIEGAFSTFRSNIVLNELKWFLTNMLIGLMTTLVLAGYAYSTLASGKALLGGTLFALFEYLRRIGDSFFEFASLYGTTVRQAADVRGAETIEEAHRRVTLAASCDGKPVEGGLRPLAARTTLLPQNPEIFADTIRFNITFGVEAAEADVFEAVRLAHFDRVLARLPQGLDTDVSEKGVNLSGGERQRLALARGIFFSRESDVVLLDEPTSSVDSYSEKQIYLSLLELYKRQCLVSSVHKLHLLPLFDEIVVLEDGRVIERGDFRALVKHGGCLATLWNAYQTAERAPTAEARLAA
ncbi:MAG: ABC transporter ATP-binding protein [Candidatus Wallbacteria bacterium]|nr:ABC transporter ATP-binding protein [Candidatus Wallbacteria bacterium]